MPIDPSNTPPVVAPPTTLPPEPTAAPAPAPAPAPAHNEELESLRAYKAQREAELAEQVAAERLRKGQYEAAEAQLRAEKQQLVDQIAARKAEDDAAAAKRERQGRVAVIGAAVAAQFSVRQDIAEALYEGFAAKGALSVPKDMDEVAKKAAIAGLVKLAPDFFGQQPVADTTGVRSPRGSDGERQIDPRIKELARRYSRGRKK